MDRKAKQEELFELPKAEEQQIAPKWINAHHLKKVINRSMAYQRHWAESVVKDVDKGEITEIGAEWVKNYVDVSNDMACVIIEMLNLQEEEKNGSRAFN